jgi:hypothetical protein
MNDWTDNTILENLRYIRSDITEIRKIQSDILATMERLETTMLSIKYEAKQIDIHE